MSDKTMIEKLYEKLPEDGIQRVSKAQSKKSYDTAGYGYQWCVDRLNDVCGVDGWGYDFEIIKEIDGTWGQHDTPFHDVTVLLKIWIGDKSNSRPHVGGHRGAFYGDTVKGAISNAFKKASAMFGVGADAYRGEIDDDHTPIENDNVNVGKVKSRLDFDEVKFELEVMKTRPEKEAYFLELKKNHPNMSEKQMNALINIFKASTTPEVDGPASDLFDDSQVPEV